MINKRVDIKEDLDCSRFLVEEEKLMQGEVKKVLGVELGGYLLLAYLEYLGKYQLDVDFTYFKNLFLQYQVQLDRTVGNIEFIFTETLKTGINFVNQFEDRLYEDIKSLCKLLNIEQNYSDKQVLFRSLQ